VKQGFSVFDVIAEMRQQRMAIVQSLVSILPLFSYLLINLYVLIL